MSFSSVEDAAWPQYGTVFMTYSLCLPSSWLREYLIFYKIYVLYVVIYHECIASYWKRNRGLWFTFHTSVNRRKRKSVIDSKPSSLGTRKYLKIYLSCFRFNDRLISVISQCSQFQSLSAVADPRVPGGRVGGAKGLQPHHLLYVTLLAPPPPKIKINK